MNEIKLERLDKSVLILWRMRVLIASIAISLAAGFSLYRFMLLCIVFLAAVWVVSALIVFFYFPARYRNLSFSLGDSEIVLKDGVFYRTESVVPLFAVQFTSVEFSPLQGYFGFCNLKISLAGQSVTIPDLKRDRAVAIVSLLELSGPQAAQVTETADE